MDFLYNVRKNTKNAKIMNRHSIIKEHSISVEFGVRAQVARAINYFLLKHSFKGRGKIRQLVVKWLIPTTKGSTICPTNYGFYVIINPVIDKGLERSVYLNGTYEAGTIEIMKKYLRQDDIFVDVGSNIGFMSLAASLFVGNNGRVYSFEPEPEIFAILTKNIEVNKISNVFTYNIAIGSIEKMGIIYSNLAINRGSASLIKPTQKSSAGKEVLIKTLDEFASTNNIENIRMVKIDVEGYELEVLKGAKNLLKSPSAPIICVEYSRLHPHQNGQLEDIYYYITAVNHYKIYKLKKGKEIPSRLIRIANVVDLPYHDNLFCFLPIHLKDS